MSSYLVLGQIGRPTSIPVGRSAQHIKLFAAGSSTYLSMAEFEVLGRPRAKDKEKDGLPDYFEDRNGNNSIDSGETDFKGPIVTFTAPADGFSISTTRMNVRGTISQLSSSLKRVAVNGINAFLTGNAFDVLNVPLTPGANKLIAIAEDINGNLGSVSINLSATGTLIDPITLTATPVGGFKQLNVVLQSQASVPGTIQNVKYDFVGDNTTTPGSLGSVNHTYALAGEYFPVVTVSTLIAGTLINFSSVGGFTAAPGERLQIVVQETPPNPSTITVQVPVDLKVASDGSLYVLSQSSPSKVTQFDQNGSSVRVLSGVGTSPSGLDIDSDGKVYVAATGDNQILRFTASFQLDTTFGSGGHIGRTDKAPGSGVNEFNGPYDVTVAADNTVYVSDSNNHRISKFSQSGAFLLTFGTVGSGIGQLNAPKGLSFAVDGSLMIADHGNNRVAFALNDRLLGIMGSAGSALGQYQGPGNVSSDIESIFVADTGNNRIQKLGKDLLNPLWTIGPNIATLNQPKGVSVGDNSLEERVFIADTGNGRIVVVTIPKVVPDGVWADTRQKLINGQIEDALKNFATATVDAYRQEFANLGNALVSQYMNDIGVGALTPAYIDADEALYYFTSVINSVSFTFFVTLTKENGQWKIRTF